MVVRILSDLEAATLPPSPGLALPRVYGRNSGASSAEWPLQADRGIAAPQAFRQGQPHVLDQIVFPNNHIQPQEIHPLRLFPCSLRGFPGGSDSKESACNAGDLGSILGGEDPLQKGETTHSSVLAGEFRGQRSRAEEPGRLQSVGSEGARHD